MSHVTAETAVTVGSVCGLVGSAVDDCSHNAYYTFCMSGLQIKNTHAFDGLSQFVWNTHITCSVDEMCLVTCLERMCCAASWAIVLAEAAVYPQL